MSKNHATPRVQSPGSFRTTPARTPNSQAAPIPPSLGKTKTRWLVIIGNRLWGNPELELLVKEESRFVDFLDLALVIEKRPVARILAEDPIA